MSYDTYNVADITKKIGRAKTTFLRWEKEGKVPQAHRDEKGWRYYTDEEFENIINLIKETIIINSSEKK